MPHENHAHHENEATSRRIPAGPPSHRHGKKVGIVLLLTIGRALSLFDNIAPIALFCRNVGLYQDLRHAARSDVASRQQWLTSLLAAFLCRKSLPGKTL
jgi:hypothetical protein